MPLYLSPYIGTGVHGDPYRWVGHDIPGASGVDIRLDCTRADGNGIGFALVWIPIGFPDPAGSIKLADDYGDLLTNPQRNRLNRRTGLNFGPDTTIQDAVETIMVRGDLPGLGAWKTLRPANGRYECWLGSGSGRRRWVDLPAIAGGSITDNFNRSNETPLASPWTQLSGSASTMNLASNAITHASTGDTFYYYSNGGGWNADQTSEFLYASAITDGDFGPAVRVGSSGFSGYAFSNYAASDFRGAIKFVSGSYSVIESSYTAVPTGETIGISAVGSTIRCYRNGAEDALSPATDTSLSTAGNGAGLFIYATGGSLDDFLATGEISGGTTYNESPSDSLTPTEALVKSVGKTRGDTLGTAEAFLKSVNKSLAESASLTENFLASKVALRSYSDSLSATEAFLKTVGKPLAESAVLTESFLKTASKPLAESVVLTEGFVKGVNRSLADSVSLTEDFLSTKVALRSYSDSLSATEGFVKQLNKSVAESAVLTEARVLTVGKTFDESVGLSEGFTTLKARFLNLGDTLGVTEALTKFLSKITGESVTLTENLQSTKNPGAPTPVIARSTTSIGIGIGIG